MPERRLTQADLPSDTESLARYLIGKILVHDFETVQVAGRIVETEAYVIGDASSHAFRGRTTRNASMFAGRGTAYVYFIYGTSYCLNVASEESGVGAAVLIRALEPMDGVAEMQRRRGRERLRDLARGPGRLTVALGIDRRHDGLNLCGDSPLRLLEGSGALPTRASVRIGLTRETGRVLRFFVPGCRFVSGPQRLNV